MSTVPDSVMQCSFPRNDVPKTPRDRAYLTAKVCFGIRNFRFGADSTWSPDRAPSFSCCSSASHTAADVHSRPRRRRTQRLNAANPQSKKRGAGFPAPQMYHFNSSRMVLFPIVCILLPNVCMGFGLVTLS